MVVKTTPGDRMAYTVMDPTVFSLPENFSKLNYMLVQMNLVDSEEIQGLLIQGWRLVFPKRGVAQLKR